jgi:hypothetical protein
MRGAKWGDASSRDRQRKARKVKSPGEQRLHFTGNHGGERERGWPCEQKPPERRCQAEGFGRKAQGRINRGKPRVGRKVGERLWRVKPRSVGSWKRLPRAEELTPPRG